MARPRAYNRQELLDRAIELFWERGYKATSVQDLVTATGVNRASLYQEFGSKAGLFAMALEQYMAAGELADVFEADESTPFVDLLRAVFLALVEIAVEDRGKRGCLLTNTAVELSSNDGDVSRRIAENLDNLERVLTRRVIDGQGRGELDLTLNPVRVARYIINNIQGFRVLSKLRNDRVYLRDLAEMAVQGVERG
jgi:TetR/AcrR family transcriptional repressor of nem operon